MTKRQQQSDEPGYIPEPPPELKRVTDGHTEKMLTFHVGQTLNDSGWICRHCGEKFSAQSSAFQTPCETRVLVRERKGK